MCVCYLYFSRDTVGDLVSEFMGSGVGLGQEVRVGKRAILRLHDLAEGERRRKRV